MHGGWWGGVDELSSEQREIMAIDTTQSHLIIGPPGSGKTNLLLLHGAKLAREGRNNFRVVVLTRTLREFIVSGCARYSVAAAHIQTSQSFVYEFLREQGIDCSTIVPETCKYDESRRLLFEAALQYIRANPVEPPYAVLALDEVQDYTKTEFEVFSKLARTILAAGDPHQQIYKFRADEVLEPELYFGSNIHRIRFHYRNGRKILTVADKIAQGMDNESELLETTSQYDERKMPSSVNENKLNSISDCVAKSVERIRQQLVAYPDELIGVICPVREALNEVKRLFYATDLCDLVVSQDDMGEMVNLGDTKRICLCTVHSAKGLEFRAVHIMCADFLRRLMERNRRSTYTAVTRAKTSLDVYYTGSLSAFFSEALQPYRVMNFSVSLEDLFERE